MNGPELREGRNLIIEIEYLVKENTEYQISQALNHGADGVFLVNRPGPVAHFMNVFTSIRKRYPNVWMGVNFRGLNAIEAMKLVPKTAEALWIDNVGYINPQDVGELEAFQASRRKSEWMGLCFGGSSMSSGVDAARVTSQYVDVYVDAYTFRSPHERILDPAFVPSVRAALGEKLLAARTSSGRIHDIYKFRENIDICICKLEDDPLSDQEKTIKSIAQYLHEPSSS